MSSTLTLSLPNSTSTLIFNLTSAQIIENFDDILRVECEAYYEGIQDRLIEVFNEIQDFFYATLILSSPISTKRINNLDQKFFLVGERFDFVQKSIQTQKTLNQKFFFSFVLHSPLYLLKHNVSSRIFYQKSIVDIILGVLSSYAPIMQKEIDSSCLQADYSICEYITQYKESDLDFVQRICFNSGIFLFERDDKIYLCDTPFVSQGESASASYESLVDKYSYPYKDNPNNPLGEEYLHHLSFSNHLSCKTNFFSSFNPLTPSSTQTTASLSLHSKDSSFSSLQHHASHNPSLTLHEERHSHLSSLRKQMEGYTLGIQSNIIALKLGDEIKINNLSSLPLPEWLKDKEEKYKIVSLTHYFQDKADLSSTFGDDTQTSSYYNALTLLPSSIPFFTRSVEKPIVYGGLLGLVVGENEENILENMQEQKNTIHTDPQGRIRVAFAYSLAQSALDQKRFAQDHSSSLNQSLSTCYLRVLSPIASENSGFFALPRIGDEVLIQFLEGDCDKPIIAGSLYNSSSPLPHPLGEGYHYTSISASSLGKENANKRSELVFKTQHNQEEIYLYAQKDYLENIQNNYSQSIKQHKSITIQGTHTEHIGLAYIQNIGGLRDINVGAESMENVVLSKDTQVGGSCTLNVGAEYQLRVSQEAYENIGGDKEMSIGGNLDSKVEGDKIEEISGNMDGNIKGEYRILAQNNMDFDSQTQIHLKAKNNIDLQSENFSILNSNSTNLETKALGILSESGTNLEDAQEINFQVKEGTIQIKSDTIILKAGGVEVVISKDGLVVKGGEIKSE